MHTEDNSNLPFKDNLSIYYQNVRGLNTKLNILYNSLTASSYDILALSETWLDSNIENSEIVHENYVLFRSDRDKAATNRSRGGGVMLAVRSSLNAVNLNLKNSSFRELSFIDIVGVKIVLNHYHFYVFALYIPPNMSSDFYNSVFDTFCALNFIYNSDIIIIGDFNMPGYYSHHLNSVSPATQVILNFQNFLNIEQFNSIVNSNNKLLDLVLSNRSCRVVEAPDILLEEDSHHPALLIYFNAQSNGTSRDNKKYISYAYNFRKANFPLLYEMFSEVDWNLLYEFSDVHLACEKFYEILEPILNECVPIKRKPNRSYPPWFNSKIIKNIKEKHTAWRLYKSDGNEEYLKKFKDLRRIVKSDIETAHRNYNKHVEENIAQNPSEFWRYVNMKRNVSNLPKNIKYNDDIISDPQVISNSFAEYFQQSYSTPEQCNVDNEHNVFNNSYLNVRNFTEDEVLKALKKLKPKLTSGPDNIPSFVVRDCAAVFAKPLCLIFNLSLQTSTFPQCWKQSKIIPVFKKGDRSLITNYRPIVILNNFAKVLEMLLYDHIFCHVKHQITEFQHGFYKGRSTVTNLFCLTEFLSDGIDDGSQVDIIYTDFSKAFDKLNHSILLQKLHTFGFSPDLINYFSSYLNNRTQYVLYCGHKSVEVLPTSGVPQGSNLGPLLFIMFINDIVTDITLNCLLYADDLKIFCRITSIEDCLIMQHTLDLINNWCVKNKLLLNPLKCNVLSITTKKTTIKYDYTLENSVLSRPDTFTDLGVVFDEKLSFTHHINRIIEKSYKSLGFLIRNTLHFSNATGLKLLYFSIVRSNLEYASLIWSPYYKTHIDNLENIQRRFLKYSSFKVDGVYPPIGYPHSELLSRFSVVSLEDRRKVSYLTFLYRLIHNITDSTIIMNMLPFHAHRTGSRQTDLFKLITPRTNIKKFSPLQTMCSIYNNIHERTDIFSCNIASLKACISYQ